MCSSPYCIHVHVCTCIYVYMYMCMYIAACKMPCAVHYLVTEKCSLHQQKEGTCIPVHACTSSYCIWLLNLLYVQFNIVYVHVHVYCTCTCTYNLHVYMYMYMYICIYSSGRKTILSYCPSTLKYDIQVASIELNLLSLH